MTGAHNFKFGYVGGYLVEDIENHGNDLNLAYTFNSGVPISLTESLRVFTQSDRVRYTALYAQDQWTLGRITLQGALRFDHAWSYSPAQTIGPALIGGQTFLATPLTFGRTDGVNYKDISPRGGVAWDVFGNGKTAVKINVGTYEDPASNLNSNYSICQPDRAHRDHRDAQRGPATARRSNIMTVPSASTGSRTATSRTTRPTANVAASDARRRSARRRRRRRTIDPALLNGWGIRPNDWQIGASVQQQLVPRVSVEVGYFKRWLQNFTATDNTLVVGGDFTPFSITAPSDPRLPERRRLHRRRPLQLRHNKFGQTSNNITDAGNFGKQYQSYNGLLINFTARAAQGLNVHRAASTPASTVTDNCEVRAALIEGSLGIASSTAQNTYCHNDPGFITKANAIASYIVPKVDVLVAMTFRWDQGAPLRANWNAPIATVVQPALGRPSRAARRRLPINLIAPGDVWGDRVNELDFRFAKILRFGRMRINAGIDFYNILNQAAILTYSQTFAPGGQRGWRRPRCCRRGS